ncbi:MAG TPA: CoA transferase [Casimicrobiaceae bacterium]|nr:CoA transferase [Casimicrobiaceae bacterium]
MSSSERALLQQLWTALDGVDAALDALHVDGPAGGLPSRFHVSDLAVATVGVATLAAAELWAARRNEALRAVTIDRRLAAAAFRCEALLKPIGWTRAPGWDAIAGDYEAADGWIRLHTNFSYHRDAVTAVLGVPAARDRVAAAVKSCNAAELESAVVEAGGCAAALRTMDEWSAHPQGAALAGEAVCEWEKASAPRTLSAAASAPLAGVRVLDMTRVIAGPVATRYLAAMGADVLRVDPPAFEEMQALLPETTRGKRCTALNLRNSLDRSAWQTLVSTADVLVHGYRPGAMEALDYSRQRLCALNPRLLVVRYDAYGWSGPWAARRGFDSLVQMSTGIAHPGHDGHPTPLPAQALDHGTGYLVAAAVCRGLTEGRPGALLSLARTARLLTELGTDGDPGAPALGDVDALLEHSDTAWGPARHVPCPGRVEGHDVRWRESAGPIGRHPARWIERDAP